MPMTSLLQKVFLLHEDNPGLQTEESSGMSEAFEHGRDGPEPRVPEESFVCATVASKAAFPSSSSCL